MASSKTASAANEKLIERYPEDVQILARRARTTLREWLPNATEGEDGSAKMIAFSFGPGYRGVVCTLLLSKSGVKIGIAAGASLPDPHKLMRGEGKVHRHVPLRESGDLKEPGLKQLVLDAAEACRKRLSATKAATR